MCGIAGIISKKQSNLELEYSIKRAMDILKHRGPDNSAYHIMDSVCMGHTRLSIIDTSESGNQPFYNKRFLLSYNGEIYNYKLLQNIFLKGKVKFKSTSDTEVLFWLLVHTGVDKTLNLLKGMFAFSFYSAEDQTVYLCRDRLGIKPLYWIKKGNELFWASEVKALSRMTTIEVDHLRTMYSVSMQPEVSNCNTLFKNVRLVPPGCYLKYKIGGQPKIIKYYDLNQDVDKNYYFKLERLNFDEIKNHFTKLLNDSIQSMLMSDVPIGSFVSGGLDSSLITVIAKELNADLKLFSSDTTGKYSEIQYAKLLANETSSKISISKYDMESFINDLSEATFHYETPVITHQNSLPFAKLAGLARSEGVKPVLTGEGSDELFFGYPHAIFQNIKKYLLIPQEILKKLYFLVPRLGNQLFPSMDSRALLQNIMETDVRAFRKEAEESFKFLPNKSIDHQVTTMHFLKFHLHGLLHRNDRMGMIHSIESRFPFLDENIIKFGINLPYKWKVKYSFRFHDSYHPFIVDKYILREKAAEVLSKKLAYRSKRGFPIGGILDVRIDKNYFNNGYVEEIMRIDKRGIESLFNLDEYFVGKLVLIDIFGRLFHLNQKPEFVKGHLNRYLSSDRIYT